MLPPSLNISNKRQFSFSKIRQNSSDRVATIISASAGSGKITLTCEADGSGGGGVQTISLEEVASYLQLSNGTRNTLTNRVTCTTGI